MITSLISNFLEFISDFLSRHPNEEEEEDPIIPVAFFINELVAKQDLDDQESSEYKTILKFLHLVHKDDKNEDDNDNAQNDKLLTGSMT